MRPRNGESVAEPTVAPPATYSAGILGLLQLFGGVLPRDLVECCLRVDARHWALPCILEESRAAAPIDAIPLSMLALLTHGYTVRANPALLSSDLQGFRALRALVARWEPAQAFGKQPDGSWRHHVTDIGEATVQAGLRMMLPPTVVVDGGNEVWAAWLLEAPIRDERVAIDALRALAARVGSVAPAGDPAWPRTFTVPMAGAVRNWNLQPADFIDVVRLDANRRYTLEVLFSQPQESYEHTRTTEDDRDESQEQRRSARRSGQPGSRAAR